MDITLLAEELGALLSRRNQQVATAESCTGGGVAEAITRIPGSSAWFEAGYVTYSNRQKTQMLQVPPNLLEQHGAVSLPVVQAMVRGACAVSGARYAVAISGVAGPGGGSAEKPVGMVCFAWQAGERQHTQTCLFAGDRAAVRQQSVKQALSGLISLLQYEEKKFA